MLGKATLLGRQTLGIDSQAHQTWQATGFFAQAYDVSQVGISDLSGQVISYRGADKPSITTFNTNDILSGWLTGGGAPERLAA